MNSKKGRKRSPGANFRRFGEDFRRFLGRFWDVKCETKRRKKKRNKQKSEEKRRQETHRTGHERRRKGKKERDGQEI